jgi:predicted Zn-dependent peptidase
VPPLQKNRARAVEPAQVTKLANGLTVVSQDCHGAVASLGLHVLAGSRFEGPARGTAHFLEHAAFKLGSTSRSGLKLQLDAESMGGSLSASAGREEVRVSTPTPHPLGPPSPSIHPPLPPCPPPVCVQRRVRARARERHD